MLSFILRLPKFKSEIEGMINPLLPKKFQWLIQIFLKGSQQSTPSNQDSIRGNIRISQQEELLIRRRRFNSSSVLSPVTTTHYFRMNSQAQKRNKKKKMR